MLAKKRSGPRSASAGGRFSEVGNWDFNSRPEALSALGSVSASWSVRVRRFYCTVEPNKGQVGTSTNVHS